MSEALQVLNFNDLVEKTQYKVAEIIRGEMEQRTGILTKPVEEWVRVMQLGNTQLEINLTTRKMNITPASKPLLELHVREYLLAGIKKGGPADV